MPKDNSLKTNQEASLDPPSSVAFATDSQEEPMASEPPPQKKRSRRVGQRKPKRDRVGS